MFREMNNIAKETITILDYFDSKLIEKIPTKFLNYLKELALTSNSKIDINLDKSLTEQNISEESKDLISLIYYRYIADEKEKKQIVEVWKDNEYKNSSF